MHYKLIYINNCLKHYAYKIYNHNVFNSKLTCENQILRLGQYEKFPLHICEKMSEMVILSPSHKQGRLCSPGNREISHDNPKKYIT